jgi:hypothetical protein
LRSVFLIRGVVGKNSWLLSRNFTNVHYYK